MHIWELSEINVISIKAKAREENISPHFILLVSKMVEKITVLAAPQRAPGLLRLVFLLIE